MFGRLLSSGPQSTESLAQKAAFAVDVQGISKSYRVGTGLLAVLKDVSFTVEKGELIGITGRSGSGKSTLLHLLGALDTPSRGKILIEGKNPFLGNDHTLSHFRNRHVGFVFQQNNLLPEFTALENVMMPGLIAGSSQADVTKKALSLIERVGMGPRKSHRPGQLSGGEQQRIAIARALINNPTILLADEPSGNLDTQNASNIHNLFFEINELYQTTVIIVTHNLEFASTLPRVLEMQDGCVLSDTGKRS